MGKEAVQFLKRLMDRLPRVPDSQGCIRSPGVADAVRFGAEGEC